MSHDSSNKNLYAITVGLYVLINSLFVYKYGVRQDIIHPLLILGLYVILSVSFLLLVRKDSISLPKNKFFTYLYWVLAAVCASVFSFIIFSIDGESLNTDRWSALELTVEGITDGMYPYTRLDHLGKMSSNFPALGFLGLPFYLLGDVGYLQVFTFILFALYLYKKSNKIVTSFYVLGLFILSPALLWEIVAKSDLTTNIVLVVLFIEWWTSKNHSNTFRRPVLLGAIISFFLLTRGIVIIPLIFFFLKDFWDTKLITKTKFVASVSIMGLLISLPILLSIPDWDTFMNYNPMTLQTNKAPSLSYLFLLTPFVVPFIIKKYKDYHFYIAVVIFAIPFTGMINSVILMGWHQTIFEHKYDISYLSMCIPPLLMWIKNNAEIDSINNPKPLTQSE